MADRRLASLASNTAVIGVGTVLAKGLALALVPISTFFLSPAEYGQFDLAVTYLSLFVPAATLQLEQGIFRYVFEDRTKARSYFTAAFSVVSAVATVGALSIWLIASLALHASWAPALAAYFLGLATFACCIEYLRGLGKLVQYSMFNVAVAFGVVVLAGTLVGYCGLGIAGLMWSLAIPYGLGSIAILSIFRPINGWPWLRTRRRTISEMASYSAPLVPNVISYWIVSVSDRTLVSLYLGAAANGLYAVGAKVPALLSVLFGIFNISFQQSAVEAVNDPDRESFFGRLFTRSTRFLLGISCAVSGGAPWLFHVMVGRDFTTAYNYVPGLVLGAVFLSMAQYLGNLLIAFRRTRAVGVSTAAGAAANVALNLMLLPTVGIQGAVIATVAGYGVMFAVRYRIVGIPLFIGPRGRQLVLPAALYLACSVSVYFFGSSPYYPMVAVAGLVAAALVTGGEWARLISTLMRR